jgi:hypothetical protein
MIHSPIHSNGTTMYNDIAVSDLDYICFGGEPGAAPFLEAAGRLAAGIDLAAPARRSAAACAAAAERIARLGLDDILPELDARDEALPLLFEVARLFGHANPAAGWRGMAGAPARLLDPDRALAHVALPDGAGRFVLWLPDARAQCARALYWFDPVRMQLRGPVPASAAELPARQQGLSGMPCAAALILPARAALRDCAVQPLAPGAWELFCRAQRALLSGLICGACRRLRDEAYGYARLRQSGGKPIIQLQAVALRLANLALGEQALSLYAAAAARPAGQADAVTAIDSLNVAYVNQCAFDIARDAVQVAAGHGYVEGLPFKRLFEQVHTLASVLASYAHPCTRTGD